MIFCLLVFVAYVLTFYYVPGQYLDSAVNTVGQIATLTFAIFVGWVAFIQVAEFRLEKQKTSAHDYFSEGSHKRARELYESVYYADPKDFINLAELMELYVITQNDRFEKHVDALEDCTLEEDEILIVYYLKIARHLLKSDIGSARGQLKECLDFIKSNRRSLSQFGWSFEELKGSEQYLQLGGDSKKILDNLIAHLSRSMSPEDMLKFEGGNFELS